MATPSVLAIPTFEPESGQFTATVPDSTKQQPSLWGLPEWFAVSQVAGPALLYLPGSQPFRVPLRMGVFALSLMGLVWCLRRSRFARVHPSWILLVSAAVYMAVMLLHPATNTTMAGLAQIGMHFAVAAPLFWAPYYFLGGYQRLARVLTILWALNGASVVVGILQVRDPGTWMPAEFSSNLTNRQGYLRDLQYRAGDGTMTQRPPGLGDSPGAACGAGMFVAILGLAYLGVPVSKSRKLLGILMGMAGVVVIFLSHVRSSLVVVVGCAVIYSIILVGQGRLRTALTLALLMAVCGFYSLLYAESLGGQSTVDRFATLLEDDPSKVYEKSYRMGAVTGAFDTLLVEHPLGAGLGRWGMMRVYFGDETNYNSPMIWAEVQFQAWIIDGGIVLLSLYLIALAVAVQRLARICFFHQSLELRRWAAVIVMLSAGPIAFLFSYCPFYSQLGIQFWFLIGAFEGLAQGEEGDPVPEDRGETGIPLSPESVGEDGS
ncbi:MAG: hypothetical protein JO114_17545 [Planctomycetaceae bacterium]|nr:hypothetical protein [Planctomycetaceae bacterium]